MPLWRLAFPTAWGCKKYAWKPETVNSFVYTRWLSLVHIVILSSSMSKLGPSIELEWMNTLIKMCGHTSSYISSPILGGNPSPFSETWSFLSRIYRNLKLTLLKQLSDVIWACSLNKPTCTFGFLGLFILWTTIKLSFVIFLSGATSHWLVVDY